jgi:hypothetical protein
LQLNMRVAVILKIDRSAPARIYFYFLHSTALYTQAEAGPIYISPVMSGGACGNMSLLA